MAKTRTDTGESGAQLAMFGANGAEERVQRTDPEWISKAYDAIEHLASLGLAFTSEDVLSKIGVPKEGDTRALGAIFKKSAACGWIERAGVKQATRNERHAGWVTIWRAGRRIGDFLDR